uniref:hypothetical protein n=1 Tax=uncultured Sphingomonas sp. TaxID=158754 RepID=UPI0035CBCBCD
MTYHTLFAIAGFTQRTAAIKDGTAATCDANELVASIHPKAMITVLKPADHVRWLRGSYDNVVALQQPSRPIG